MGTTPANSQHAACVSKQGQLAHLSEDCGWERFRAILPKAMRQVHCLSALCHSWVGPQGRGWLVGKSDTRNRLSIDVKSRLHSKSFPRFLVKSRGVAKEVRRITTTCPASF